MEEEFADPARRNEGETKRAVEDVYLYTGTATEVEVGEFDEEDGTEEEEEEEEEGAGLVDGGTAGVDVGVMGGVIVEGVVTALLLAVRCVFSSSSSGFDVIEIGSEE